VGAVEAALAARLERGDEALLATVVRRDGAPPAEVGAKLLTDRDAPLAGTLGCSEFDAAVLADAAELFDSGTPQLRTYSHDLGTVEALLEPHRAAPLLVVAGATPVAAALQSLAATVGLRTVLVETRPERAAAAPSAPPHLLDLGELPPRLAGRELYCVLTDHDAPDVADLVGLLLPHHPRYLGVVGSRRHVAAHIDTLRARGVDEEQLSTVRTPVGLDLGGRSAEEIALSALAGVIAARHGRPGGWLDRPPHTPPPRD